MKAIARKNGNEILGKEEETYENVCCDSGVDQDMGRCKAYLRAIELSSFQLREMLGISTHYRLSYSRV